MYIIPNGFMVSGIDVDFLFRRDCEVEPVNLPPNRDRWPQRWLELWAERAAIIEYQANVSRATAELRAEQDIRKVAAREPRQERTA
jgi:hypothetical protein